MSPNEELGKEMVIKGAMNEVEEVSFKKVEEAFWRMKRNRAAGVDVR